ncbi:MAG: alpha-glucan family phosphorylase, partial [Promethearchaeota archaeon]
MTEVKKNERQLAYFSMEIALEPDIPTYSGGLGVLAGDTLRSMADLEIPAVAITLSYSTGYFYQVIDPSGYQTEREIRWEFSSEFDKVPVTITLPLQDGKFHVGAWRYDVVGQTGHVVPVYLLDTNIDSNEPWQRQFTHVLYDATPFQRFVQEMILGMGGVELLKALGYKNVKTYHMNEGHAALLSLQLLGDGLASAEEAERKWSQVKEKVIFTTHTPVPAGHDKFDYDLVNDVFRERVPPNIRDLAGEKKMNMTVLALNASRWANAVSQKHGEVTREMFPDQPHIDAITNGVHSNTWTCDPIQALFDKYLPGWRMRPRLLSKALEIDSDDLLRAHQKAKRNLLDYEKSHSWVLLDKKLLTIGFARRVTGYKRHMLVFRDPERLARICRKKVQFIFAGKAHPRDNEGKNTIKKIHEVSDYLWESYGVRVVFLENYDMDLSKLMTSGVDI